MMDVAASGGYYLAMAADSILVHPSTVTGSIGVIMLTVNARGLLEKVGVEANAITSGPRKDMGSPFRVMTPEERGIFQSVIDSFYQRFLAVVQEGRPNLSGQTKNGDGRIYSGDQAKAGLTTSAVLDDALERPRRKEGSRKAGRDLGAEGGTESDNIYSRMFGTSWASPGSQVGIAVDGAGWNAASVLWMP